MSTQLTPTEKVCTECKETKPLDDFSAKRSKCKACISRYNTQYRKANADKLKVSNTTYRQENKDSVAAYQRIYRQKNKEVLSVYKAKYYLDNKEAIIGKAAKYYVDKQTKIIKYRQANKEKISIYNTEYELKNKESRNIYRAQYRKNNREVLAIKASTYASNNPDKINARNAKRRASKLQRTVLWANNQIIKSIYKDCEEINLAAKAAGCSESFVIDHIIPLQGKLVSGLHVETNLQILTNSENCSKGNKFTPA